MYCAVGLGGKGVKWELRAVEIEGDSRKCVVQWLWGERV